MSCWIMPPCASLYLPNLEGCSTFEKVDFLFAMVAMGGCREGRIYIIRDLLKSHTNVSWVVIIQHLIFKPPVFISLQLKETKWHTCNFISLILIGEMFVGYDIDQKCIAANALKMYVFPWQLMRVKAASMGPDIPHTSLMSLG